MGMGDAPKAPTGASVRLEDIGDFVEGVITAWEIRPDQFKEGSDVLVVSLEVTAAKGEDAGTVGESAQFFAKRDARNAFIEADADEGDKAKVTLTELRKVPNQPSKMKVYGVEVTKVTADADEMA